jgi:TonB family protein
MSGTLVPRPIPCGGHAGRSRRAAVALVVWSTVGLVSCVGERGRSIRQGADGLIPSVLRGDELPVLLNENSPFVYPRAMWELRIQGNVTLRLHVDANGRALPESATVARTSGVPALDSAAVASVPALRFRPARRDGLPIGLSLLVPVHYRHPDGPPMPGDTATTASDAR